MNSSNTHRTWPQGLLALSLVGFLTILTAGCSGGGSSDTGTTPVTKGPGKGGSELNKGSYDEESFRYEDPNPKEFQPLPGADFRALERKELVVLGTRIGEPTTWQGFALGEAQEKFALDAGLPKTSLGKGGLLASQAGAWDERAGDELVAVSVVGSELHITVRGPGATPTWKVHKQILVKGVSAFAATIALADVDGDGKNEIVMSYHGSSINRTYEFLVFDDAAHGAALLYRDKGLTGINKPETRLWIADFDGDGKAEILEGRWQPGARSFQLQVRELADKGFKVRRRFLTHVVVPRRPMAGLVVGNFDRDASLELASVSGASWTWSGSFFNLDPIKGFRRFDTQTARFSQKSLILRGLVQNAFGLTACDLDGNGMDEIAVGVNYITQYSAFRAGINIGHIRVRNDSGNWASRQFHDQRWMNLASTASGMSMQALDDDADNRDELRILSQDLRTASPTHVWRCEASPSAKEKGKLGITLSRTGFVKHNWGTGRLWRTQLVAGDFDGQDLLLRSTGRKWTNLSDPMPIVLMAAPPTKSGISQNIDASYTSYAEEKSVERSHGISTGWSASFSRGVAVEDITGTFGASVKATMTTAVEKTLTKSKKITYTSSFVGSPTEDVIVFQGTLYTCYEYKILRSPNPKLIGTFLTINDPVATQIYKWTLPFYNRSVAERSRYGREVMNHTVGKPETYPKLAVSEAAVQLSGGWIHRDGTTVGQTNGGKNTTGISVSTTNSTSKTRSISVGVEAEVKIAGQTMGGSFGLDRSSVYSVSTEVGTSYEGGIGDIADTKDWNDWVYKTGLVVRRHGVDSAGKALKGMLPVQVIDYWVQTQGPAYR